ncbi:hypothetical protein C3454_06825 [Citrobacter europaeus]|nr:hypothetical protein MC47_016755 [Citrobacter freundii]ROW36861.1 hypothetical protein C3454_06825 [Citrobacter europaeus]
MFLLFFYTFLPLIMYAFSCYDMIFHLFIDKSKKKSIPKYKSLSMARLFTGYVDKINAQHPITRTGDTRYRQQVFPGLSAEMFAGGHFVR